jgi:hypothetical protein
MAIGSGRSYASVGERDEPVRSDRIAARTGDPRADDTLLLVERLRELRRRRRLGELTDQELSDERLRLLERRTRTAAWHGLDRRTGSSATPVEPGKVPLSADTHDPFNVLREIATSIGDDGRRHRAAALLDALERTVREGYQQINGVTMSRRAARLAERELDR